MATPLLNMYMTTPALTHVEQEREREQEQEHKAKKDVVLVGLMENEQLVTLLLKGARSPSDAEMAVLKGVLKALAHCINGNPKRAVLWAQCGAVLVSVVALINSDKFALHRNALRTLQALCWFHPACVNRELRRTLHCIVNLFGEAAPTESGELALDVMTQFCKIVEHERCLECLVPMLRGEIKKGRKQAGQGQGRKVFAALSILDRVIVTAPAQWLRAKLAELTELLLEAYKYHREPMRSLIYISIILDGDTSFLSRHAKEQKIVQMMAKEADFADWVRSHRVDV